MNCGAVGVDSFSFDSGNSERLEFFLNKLRNIILFNVAQKNYL
jgi:hypothetical protein